MKTKVLLFFIAVLGISLSAQAQKGNNQLQLSGQVSVPMGDLSDLANVGYGFSAKSLFGVGTIRQQVSLEIGYNSFGVKKDLLPANVNANYRSWPIYTGYRYMFGPFNLESQAGVAINTIYASNQFALASQTKAYFAYALGLGYAIEDLEFALKYQSSDVDNGSTHISFLGLRVSYSFPFTKKASRTR